MARISLIDRQRWDLQHLARRGRDARMVRRAQGLRWLDQGEHPVAVAHQLGVTRETVYSWARQLRHKSAPSLIQGLRDQPRSGRARKKRKREGLSQISRSVNALRLLDQSDTDSLDILIQLPSALCRGASFLHGTAATTRHRKTHPESRLHRTDGLLTVASDLLEHLKQTLSRTYNIKAGSIILFDKDRKDFSIWRLWGLSSRRLLALLRAADLELLGKRLITKKKPTVLRVSNSKSDQLNNENHEVGTTSHQSRSYLIIPVFSSSRTLGVVCLFRDDHPPIKKNEVPLFESFAIQILWHYVNLELAWKLSFRMRITLKRIQRLSREFERSQEKERRRIANELHDEIGQDLTALNLILESAYRDSMDPVRNKLKEGIEVVLHILKGVREFITDLHLDQLKEYGLLSTLTSYLDLYSLRTGIQIDFDYDRIQCRCHRELEVGIYRLVQEALTNVARHAKVNKASVGLKSEHQHIILRISDEGDGFDVEKAFKEHGCYGLKGMQERVKRLGGNLKIDSSIHQGTIIEVTFPVELNERR